MPRKTTGKRKYIRVVAIGASAGGLEPIEQFFDEMPVDFGVAFVIVQHLSPDFKSMMDQLIARHSSMRITHAEDGMHIEPNVVYLNPPRTELTISNGVLHTREYSDPETLGLPIDAFFRSLAEDQKEEAIGIVMSGTGSDGTRGAIKIAEAGGTVIAQDPDTAKFDSMPRSAIERGAATISATPADMPQLILNMLEGREVIHNLLESADMDDPERRILALLQKRYGANFNFYKQTTVRRRIRRRALLNQMHSVEQYATCLEDDEDELESLYCDLLIGVTAFFRDQEAYEVLEREVLPTLTASMSEKRQVRVWVPGCASGEEAYSLAMAFSEFARVRGLTLNLKIFATDIHFNSLDIASAGVYDKESLKRIPQVLVDEYFDEFGDRYQVKRFLRRLVVFSPQNLIKDPPFTRMDLVSCRNLLIYLGNDAQKKVLSLFHFALRKDGILFLGPSETPGDLSGEFEVIDKRWRFFRKRRDVQLRDWANLLPLNSSGEEDQTESRRLREHRLLSPTGSNVAIERKLLASVYDKLLEKYAPASLLVNREGELIHVFGDAEAILRVTRGEFSRKVAELVNAEFRLVVIAGLEQVFSRRAVPFQRTVKFNVADGKVATFSVGIEQLTIQGEGSSHALITVERRHSIPEAGTSYDTAKIDSDFFAERVSELERDLEAMEESLQTTIEELETSNEELQATNEELMASNEELQSTNEELHSVNEELYTVSAEHQRKIEELSELTDDMDNLLRATDIGTIFLDSDLNVRRFTPAAARTFNLVAHDIGRPLSHITYRFTYPGLMRDVQTVLNTREVHTEEISVDGDDYLLRILPYKSDAGDNPGLVLTAIDIHELKQAQQSLAQQQKLYEDVVQQQSEMICRVAPDMTLTFANEAFCAFHNVARDKVLGTKIANLIPATADTDLVSALKSLKPGESREHERQNKDANGEPVWIYWWSHAIGDSDGGVETIQLVGRDITALKLARTELESVNEKLLIEEKRYRTLYQRTPAMMHSVNESGILIEVSDYWVETLGYSRDEAIGRHVTELLAEESRSRALNETLPEFWKTGYCSRLPFQMVKKDGTVIDIELSAVKIADGSDGSVRSQAILVDVTEQMNVERALASQNEELQRINDNLNQFTHIVSHDLTGPLRAIEHTAEWIEQDTSPDARKEIQEHIDRLKDQVRHLGSMLDDLLEYSRAGTSRHDIEQIDLPRELNDIFELIEKPDRMKLVIKSVPDDLVTFRAPLLLIFRNLIENAVKYHDRDTGKITVKCEDLSNFWEFSVEDDGPGIDPKFHDKMLQPFRKLERKDKVPGNGMGLALVKKAVETNGGMLEVFSNPIERPGTRLSFTWPKNRSQTIAA